MSGCTAAWDGRVRALVTGEASQALWGAGRAHLRCCSICRAEYDRLVVALALFEGRHPGSPEGIEAHLVADLLADLPLEIEPLRPTPPRRRGWSLGALSLGGLSVAVAIGLLILPGRGVGPELTPRGGAGPTAGFRLFCIDLAGPTVRGSVSSGSLRSIRCELGDDLHFTYSLSGRHPRFLTLYSVDEQGEFVSYWPRRSKRPEAAAPGVNRSLPGSLEAGALHHGGRYQIFAAFTLAPTTPDVVEWWRRLTVLGVGLPGALGGASIVFGGDRARLEEDRGGGSARRRSSNE